MRDLGQVHVTGDTSWPPAPTFYVCDPRPVARRPRDHLAATRQRCTACPAWASSWSRCPSCRAVVARCGDHGGQPAVVAARAAHCGGRR